MLVLEYNKVVVDLRGVAGVDGGLGVGLERLGVDLEKARSVS